MVSIECHHREVKLRGTVPLPEEGISILVTYSILVVLNIDFLAAVLGLIATDHAHPFQKEIMLVHVGQKFQTKLNRWEIVTNSHANLASILVGDRAHDLLDLLSHNVVDFPIGCSKHCAIDAPNHKENHGD